MHSLRQYQADCIKDISAGFRRSKRILLNLPTGAGKTVVAGALTRLLVKQNRERESIALFLVHRKELVDQVVGTLHDFGLGSMVGVIQSGKPMTPWAPLQVASVQTLVRRYKELEWLNPLIIIVDEAHHARAQTWDVILKHYLKAYLLGLTATPARMDGKGLGEHFSEMIFGPTIRELTDMGYLCEVDCYSFPESFDRRSIPKVAGDFNKRVVGERLTNKVMANLVDAWFKICPGARTVHFAVSVKKSKELVQRFKDRGVAAEHVDGEMDSVMRESIMRRFKSGELTLISNVDIVSEGFDCPECECVLDGRPTLSLTRWKQAVGRCMRPKEDGRAGIYIDGVGNLDEHGDPDYEHEWTLDDGVIRNSQKMPKLTHRNCKKCGFRYEIKKRECPKCGHSVTRQDRWQEVSEIQLEKRKSAKPKPTAKQTRRELNIEVRDTLGDEELLREIVRRNGYKPGVINHWRRFWGPIWERMREEIEQSSNHHP